MCSTPRKRVTQRLIRRATDSADYADYAAMVRRSNAGQAQRQQERHRAMLASDHPHVRRIRIQRVACPLHVLQMKSAIRKIEPGQTLEVEVGQPAALNDLVAACHTLRHPVETVIQDHSHYLYVTRAA